MLNIAFSHSYFYPFDEKQWNNKTPFPPLGTMYAASFLREKGYAVSLFDTCLLKNIDPLHSFLEVNKPDVFVIYDDGFNYLTKMCLTNMREAAFEMILKAKGNNCKIVVCSSDATDHYEKYLNAGADFIIQGEGEVTLKELVDKFQNKEDATVIDGVVYVNDQGKIIKNPKRAVYKELDSFPMPAWDLINVNDYKNIWEEGGKEFSLNMVTTRGCPFKCNWCAKPIYGNRYNSHSPEYIVAHISYLQKNFGVKKFWMCDDIFGLKPQWVQEFNTLLKQENLIINYYIQSRADLLLKEANIEALAESGLSEVWIGAESGSQKILDAMDKGTTIAQIEKATRLLKEKNIKVAFFIQFGYLNETKEDIDLTIKMIQNLLPDNIGVSVSYPLPETAFYEKVKDDLKLKANWTDSDDLAMMFQGSFNSKFYKKLQRYVHKVFRKTQGIFNLKKMIRNPFSLKMYEWRLVFLLPYYITTSIVNKLQLNKLENIND
ncbi:radical SAM protein [Tenacibaculum sp. Bg11-29]|uniref:B12-binding domain-containing radical SAM protein n=1 Tax=Tenacibaculum sp. Bg11-29 TaxID=2058306 RepID=UPI000C33DCED|nr:radical SAM protein [Tenacibaculum sp. Bg11-29]PKH50791.1 radical SAM protein [Tenacibaculum sp. Bg11-29]